MTSLAADIHGNPRRSCAGSTIGKRSGSSGEGNRPAWRNLDGGDRRGAGSTFYARDLWLRSGRVIPANTLMRGARGYMEPPPSGGSGMSGRGLGEASHAGRQPFEAFREGKR